MSDRDRVETLLAQLDNLWACFDGLFETFVAEDWRRRHGVDWTLADVPYHLAYFDNEIIAYPLAQGPHLPAQDRIDLKSQAALQAWNASQFARRSAYYAPDRSLARWRATRAEIRAALSAMDDADLARPTWMALPAAHGWRSAEFAAVVCLTHAWNEFMELRFLSDRLEPEPRADVTHAALGEYLRQVQLYFDPAIAGDASFTAVWEIAGPGGGQWTFHVANGHSCVESGGVAQADLTIAMDALTFVKLWNEKLAMAQGLETGAIRVNSAEELARFSALYPGPNPNSSLPAAL